MEQMPDESYQEKDQEKVKEHLSDARCRQCDAGKTQDPSDQCNHEKCQSPAQHVPSCREYLNLNCHAPESGLELSGRGHDSGYCLLDSSEGLHTPYTLSPG